MNRLDKLQGKSNLRVGYVIPGYPTMAASFELAHHLLDLGIDVLEVGVPFSDPVADGPIIRTASEKALANGISLEACLHFAKTLREKKPSAALVLMSYLNPLYCYGLDTLEESFADIIDGVIVPDCPHEEMPLLRQSLKTIYPITLISATTSTHRLEAIGKTAKGFVYLVGVKGTTGGKQAEAADVDVLYRQMIPLTTIPIIAGFGIQNREQAESISQVSDGCVIASAALTAFDSGDIRAINELFKRASIT